MLHLRFGHAVRLFAEIDFLLADCPGSFLHLERAIPIGFGSRFSFALAGLQRRDIGPQHGHLIVHIFDRVLQFKSIGPRLGHHRAHFVLRHQQICLRRGDHRFFQIDIDLKRLLVELHENVPLFHPVVIVDQNLHHLARHARGDERDVTGDVSIVGRNGVERANRPSECRSKSPAPPRPTASTPMTMRLIGNGRAVAGAVGFVAGTVGADDMWRFSARWSGRAGLGGGASFESIRAQTMQIIQRFCGSCDRKFYVKRPGLLQYWA